MTSVTFRRLGGPRDAWPSNWMKCYSIFGGGISGDILKGRVPTTSYFQSSMGQRNRFLTTSLWAKKGRVLWHRKGRLGPNREGQDRTGRTVGMCHSAACISHFVVLVLDLLCRELIYSTATIICSTIFTKRDDHYKRRRYYSQKAINMDTYPSTKYSPPVI